MTAYIAGLIFAVVLAIFVVIWIAYCMFFRERHYSEAHQYQISDLQHANYQIAQMREQQAEEKPKEKKELVAGVFILPSRHKHQKEDYEQRPDYPESPVANYQAGTDKLVEILNESVAADVYDKDTTDLNYGDCSSSAAYQSDV